MILKVGTYLKAHMTFPITAAHESLKMSGFVNAGCIRYCFTVTNPNVRRLWIEGCDGLRKCSFVQEV